MELYNLIQETQAVPAIVWKSPEFAAWARKSARTVDVKSEIRAMEKLASIMAAFRYEYEWFGVSSSNIYWNVTDAPVRAIQIPNPCYHTSQDIDFNSDEYITILNPRIILEGETYFSGSAERCGLLDPLVPVARPSSITIKGYVLEEGEIRKIESSNKEVASCIKHEIDHLDGILISDYSPIIGLKSEKLYYNLIYRPIISSELKNAWLYNQDGTKRKRDTVNGKYVLLDQNQLPMPLIYIVLCNADGKMKWEIYEEISLSEKIKNEDMDYGKPIIYTMPDTPAIRYHLALLNRNSFHELFSIPVSYNLKG